MLTTLALATLAAAPVQLRTVTHAGARFDVVEVDLARASVRLHWRDAAGKPYETLERLHAALAAAKPPPVALTNAGIFEPGLVPTGLLVVDGKEQTPLNARKGSGNFYMLPNGVFAVTKDGARVVRTEDAATLEGVRAATQSGPMLLRSGALHPKLSAVSVHRTIRSGVGVASKTKVFFVISKDAVNFHALATAFRDALGCTDALYLDGAISKLWAPGLKRDELDRGSFAGLISVHER